MHYTTLRQKHPSLTYEKFNYDIKNNELICTFEYTLAPNIKFNPTIIIPLDQTLHKSSELDTLIFHLGLIEGLNYWKAAVPPRYHCAAGYLTEEQITWWTNFFIESLGELFYTNNIDFTEKNFLQITTTQQPRYQPFNNEIKQSNLILSSGGKDSAVTLELFKDETVPQATFTQVINNPIRAAQESAKIAGITNNFYAYKKIDPKLITLSQEGYIKGHVPFSAMLAFLALLVAYIHQYKNIIASNEAGANEGNLEYKGKIINHQFSKSFTFEKMLREYTHSYITPSINYYSALRGINELQIALLFSQYHQYHTIFRSCNVNSKSDSWCKKCPKCAFIFLIMSAFCTPNHMIIIFNENLFNKPEIQNHLYDLAGLRNHKPFECVGTPEETKDALILTIQQYKQTATPIPPILQILQKKLVNEKKINLNEHQEKIISYWNPENFIPEHIANKLQDRLKKTYGNNRN